MLPADHDCWELQAGQDFRIRSGPDLRLSVYGFPVVGASPASVTDAAK
jgi:hypothetical protein